LSRALCDKRLHEPGGGKELLNYVKHLRVGVGIYLNVASILRLPNEKLEVLGRQSGGRAH
jgi:hypothetical protein